MKLPISALLLGFFLPAALFAAQSVELVSPSGGASFESRAATFSFTFYPDNTTASQPLCALYIDGVRMAQQRLIASSSSSFEAANLSRAKHEWFVACEGAQAASRTFTILTLPEPSVSQNSPASGYSTSANYVDFAFTYNSNSDELYSSNCSLAIGVSFRASAMAVSGARTTIRHNMAPGENSWFVRCDRNVSGKYVTSGQRFFGVKAPPPPKANATNAANASNKTEVSGPQTAIFNISVIEKNASKAKPRLVVAQAATLGEEILLKLLDGNSSPMPGRSITVVPPGGAKFALRPTDSLGIASFSPNSTGSYAFIAEGMELSSPPALQITAPQNRMPAAQPPADAPSSAPNIPLLQIPSDAKPESIAIAAIIAAALLFLVALAAGFFLLAAKKRPPIGGKVELREVKGGK